MSARDLFNPHDLLSPSARRLLSLLTPEPIPITMEQANAPAMKELLRFGLIDVPWTGGGMTVRLTKNGRQQTPTQNN